MVHLVPTGAGNDALARDFAMKLRLAAVVLGCTTRKELAAAFRGVNPATTFDVERADKWLSGKALPRGADVYRDWSKLLALDRPLEWLASCSVDELLAVLAQPAWRRARTCCWNVPVTFRTARAGTPAPRPPDGGASFVEGAYACYSYAFSPYFPGWLIRSSMIIGPGHGVGSVAYSHNMPPSPTRFYRRHHVQRAGHADRTAPDGRRRHAHLHGAVRARPAGHRARRHAVRRCRGHPRARAVRRAHHPDPPAGAEPGASMRSTRRSSPRN